MSDVFLVAALVTVWSSLMFFLGVVIGHIGRDAPPCSGRPAPLPGTKGVPPPPTPPPPPPRREGTRGIPPAPSGPPPRSRRKR